MTNQTHPTKRLYRSTSDKMVAGIAGGIAEYLGVDSTIVRVLFIPFILIHGIGGAAYIIGWAVIPEDPAGVKPPEKLKKSAETEPEKVKPVHDDAPVHHTAPASHEVAPASPANESSRRMFGIILLLVGAYFFLRQFINLSFYGQFWPLLLVLIGVVIIFGRGRRA